MMGEGGVLLNEASVLFGRVRKYWAKRHFKIRPAVMMGESQNERYAPHFFVSADSKGLSYSVSPLETTLTRGIGSVDFKGLRGLHNHVHPPMGSSQEARGLTGLQRFWG